MTWPWRALPNSLRASRDRRACGAGIMVEPGQARLADQAVERQLSERGQEQKEAAELGMQGAGLEVEFPNVGHGGDGGARTGRPFVVGAAGQFGEAFFLKNLGDGSGGQRLAGLVQGPADVIDGEVLLAQGNDLLTVLVFLGCRVRAFGGIQEKGAIGFAAELVDQGAKTGGGITEACGDLGSWQTFDAVGAEGFVLALGGVAGLEEAVGEGR